MSRWREPPSVPVLGSSVLLAVASGCYTAVGTTTPKDSGATHDSGGYTGTTTPPGTDTGHYVGTWTNTRDTALTHDTGDYAGTHTVVDSGGTGDTGLTHDSGGFTGTLTTEPDTGGSGVPTITSSYSAPRPPGLPPLPTPGK